MLSFHVRPRVCYDLLLGVIGMVGPWLGPVWAATRRSPESLRRFSSCRHWPRWKLFMSRPVFDRFETGWISHGWCRWWRIVIASWSFKIRLVLEVGVDRRLAFWLQVWGRTWRHHCRGQRKVFGRTGRFTLEAISSTSAKKIIIKTTDFTFSLLKENCEQDALGIKTTCKYN